MTETSNCCADLLMRVPVGLFKALADPNRLAILATMACCCEAKTVTELSGCCPVDISVVSRHLRTLKEAGFVVGQKRGKKVFYQIASGQIVSTLRALADAFESCGGGATQCCCPKGDVP